MALKQLRGPHPLRQVVIDAIRWADANSSRSLQTTIGPSELGSDCMRRLAYSLSGAPVSNTTSDPWFAIIGTALHAWLEKAFGRYQQQVLKRVRWEFERKVEIGHRLCPFGHSDVFDFDLSGVIDWKIVGKTTMDKVLKSGPAGYYKVQAHTYGLAWAKMGYEVKEVIIVFLSRTNGLNATHVWSEPFNPQIALDALARLDAIDQLRQVFPIQSLPTADGCTWCPYYRPHQPGDQDGCPGHAKE